MQFHPRDTPWTPVMTLCRHQNLTLLTVNTDKLRCRRCHLTISKSDIGSGHCPECYEARGVRHSDFEAIIAENQKKTRYRCEDCGIFIEAG